MKKYNEKFLKKNEKLFVEKNEILKNKYGKKILMENFYHVIFGKYIQKERKVEKDTYNSIVIYTEKNRFMRRMVFSKYKEYKKHINSDFLITNGILYAGKKNKGENARYMCSMIIDLDGVDTIDQLHELIHRFEMEKENGEVNHITKPTFLVNSGTGFHLYYVFEEPIPLYPHIKKQLTELKRQLTRHLWVYGISSKTTEQEVQYQPITQNFRVIGSKTKLGDEYRVTAYRLNGKFKYDYWNEWIVRQARAYKNPNLVPIRLEYESKLTLEEAKEKYPEWYEKKIINKEEKNHYIVNRALYDWYKRELLDKHESIEGKRYYRIMCLAIYAKKCGIEREELEKDALLFYKKLNLRKHTHLFTKKDLHDALELYNDNYYTFPRKTISKLTGYEIKENKRNYLKQNEHLKISRYIRDIKNKNWRKNSGRKNKQKEVEGLFLKYPDLTITELSRKSGIDPKTIRKYRK